MVRERRKANLLGVGLDNTDGEIRVTHGGNFHLVGGSHDTHRSMQDKCVQFNQKLRVRGKELEELEREEFFDLAAECKMNVISPKRQSRQP